MDGEDSCVGACSTERDLGDALERVAAEPGYLAPYHKGNLLADHVPINETLA